MSDENIVQPAAPSTEKPQGEAPQVLPPPVPQVFDEAKVKELLKTEIESVSRRFQSEKDRSIAEVSRVAERAISAARREADAVYAQLGTVDPQGAELTRLRSRQAISQEHESQQAVERQQAEFDSQFKNSLTESLQALGIEPIDPRIDWATDATNYVERQKRILKSAAVINQANQKSFVEKESKKLVDEAVAKMRKESGVDSVDTSAPSGAVTADADFLRKFGSGELPMTKENKARYDKIQNSY